MSDPRHRRLVPRPSPESLVHTSTMCHRSLLSPRIAAACLAIVWSAGCVSAQAVVSPSSAFWPGVREHFSGDRAKETVAYLDQYVRWPGNRGFDASIAHIVQRLEKAGYVLESRANAAHRLTYRVERYPMAAPAWEPLGATLQLAGDAAPLLRFATNRNMLATNSFATPAAGIDAELVDAGTGTPAVLDSLNVRNKIVLARGNVGRLFAEAVTRRGARGVLAYSLPGYLSPSTNTTSIQFGSVPRDTVAQAWGILLSYAAHERLRAALAQARTNGTPVRLRVTTDVRWTNDAVEQAVIAEVRGKRAPDERFVFSAHVQEPGANDNASGVGALVEMARVASALVTAGRIDPARTITMLWGLEIRSTDRYITQDSVRARGIRWGLSLDMVGEDIRKTGGTFLIEKMPDPSAIWTRGSDAHSEWGGSPITKAQLTPHYFNDFVLARCLEQAATNGWLVKTNPYEGGSDHTPFLRAKKPGLLFWHFTDQFYHTDGDRIDKVSADELRNVGMSALVSALVLTSATQATSEAVVREVEAAAMSRLQAELALGRSAVAGGGSVALEVDIVNTWTAWYRDAIGSAADLEIGGATAQTRAAISRSQARVEAARAAAVATLETAR
jgi:aminopeptidase YwaD